MIIATNKLGTKIRWKKTEKDYNEIFGEGHLKYEVKRETGVLHIRIPLGTWDIMEALVPKILKYRRGDIVEIGMGESTTIFADFAYEAGVKLYSCDLLMGGIFNVFQKKLFKDHHCFIGKSEDFMKEYDGFPAIVFIDGQHKYEVVKKEIDFFLPRLLPDGVMFLHDTMPLVEDSTKLDIDGLNPGDVYLARQELERNPEVDVFTWPYSAVSQGLTMVMKHDSERPYWRKNGHAVN
jgi:hypothetical protein